MTIGKRIREARLSRHLTQQELVGDCITRNMLSKIENDAATPSMRTLDYLARAMGLSPGVFLSDQTLPGLSKPQRLPPVPPPQNGIEALRTLLAENDPSFVTLLKKAKQEWTQTGLALVELEAKWQNRGECPPSETETEL